MTVSRLRHYVEDRSHRGPEPDGAVSGAAGGAPCGDLVRVSLLAESGRIAAARFDAEGCAALAAAAAAACEMAEGATVLACARIGPSEIDAELGGLSPERRPRRRACRRRPRPRARRAGVFGPTAGGTTRARASAH